MKNFIGSLLVLLAVVAAAPPGRAQTIQLNGAGSTFGTPIYTKWFAEYNRIHSNVQINYQSIGSGGAIEQITKHTVDFGASDSPMTVAQMSRAPSILHFPTVLGGVVPMYNIPGVTADLKFTGSVLADIYLGKITMWNDLAITRLNPGVRFPALPIAPVHRADGSGTTYIFADYLSRVSPQWKRQVGVSTSLKWPVGVGAKGSEGVSEQVRQQPGAIGYVELIYALQNHISYGYVQNAAGRFLKATLAGVTAAAAGAARNMPKDFRVSIVNAPGKDAYPISSFTWLLVYQHQQDSVRGRIIKDFLYWMMRDGQKYCASLGYAPLPAPVIRLEEAAVRKVQY